MKISQTTYNVWWNNGGEDFPSLTLLNEFKDSFVESKYKINYINQFQGQAVINIKDFNITCFKVDYDGMDTQYFIVKSIERKMSNGTMVINLDLDIFSSYGYKLLEIKDKKFLTKRTHRFNKLFFQLNDDLINSVPVYYEDNVLLNKDYEVNEDGYVSISINDGGEVYLGKFKSFLNANIYYVFSSGMNLKDTTKYTIVPMLSLTEKPIISSRTNQQQQLSVEYFKEGGNFDAVRSKIREYEKQYIDVNITISTSSRPEIPSLPSGISNYDYSKTPSITRSVRQYTKSENISATSFRNYAYTQNNITYILEGKSYSGSSTTSASKISTSNKDFPPFPSNSAYKGDDLTIRYYGSVSGDISMVEVKNSKEQIEKLLQETKDSNGNVIANEYINKFKGIYFLPNTANFIVNQPAKNDKNFKDFIAIEIPPEGIQLKNFEIVSDLNYFDGQLQLLEWDSLDITSIIHLQFLNLTYYDNLKEWNFYYNFETQSIDLSGTFFFNGTGTIVSNVGIDKTYNNVIVFPYQLPSAVDEYIKYYSGIMSSVNTGIEGQKKNYEINKGQLLSNTISSGIGGGLGLIGQIASGNVLGGISSANSFASGIVNNVYNKQRLELSNEMYYKGLKSQFEDVQRTQTTNFNNSAITDLSFIYSNYGKINSESVQVRKLTEDSIKVINNLIYLYGYQNIGWYNWNELLIYDTFNYVEFASTEMVRIILNNIDFNVKNLYDIIINFWSSGRRLWNIKPELKQNNLLIKRFYEKKK
ncbi:MAG: hypothetical protein ACRCUM_02790 [Mycoplasmoidaceae bacterium]